MVPLCLPLELPHNLRSSLSVCGYHKYYRHCVEHSKLSITQKVISKSVKEKKNEKQKKKIKKNKNQWQWYNQSQYGKVILSICQSNIANNVAPQFINVALTASLTVEQKKTAETLQDTWVLADMP